MKRTLLPLVLLAAASAVALVAFFGCNNDDGDAGTDGQPVPTTNSFKFVVISDVHVRLPGNPDDALYNNAGNIATFNETLSLIASEHTDADFVIVSGDMTGCLFSDDPADYGAGTDNPAETFRTMMGSLPMPYYVALGNHDYEDGFSTTFNQGITATNPAGMEAVWKTVLGIDPFYAFVHKGVRFIFLNANRGASRFVPCLLCTVEQGCEGSFDEAQLTWLEAQLANPQPCILILHHPLITDHNADRTWSPAGAAMQVKADDRFYAVAHANRDRIRAIFVGHGHVWEEDTLSETIPVYETASIGDFFGSSDNIRAVTVDPATGAVQTQTPAN